MATAGTDLAPGTVAMLRTKGGHLARLLGPLEVNQVSLDHVQSYIQQRLDEGAARVTVQKELCTLRQALRQAHDRRRMREDPRRIFPRFRHRYVPRERWLTPAELALLLGELQPRRRAWVLLAVYTGARFSELEALAWEEHVNLAEGWLLVPGSKTVRSRRRVPIHDPLRQILEALPQRRGPLVQPWSNVRRDLALACGRARISRVTPNDLRRTFASWLKQKGVDSLAVAQLLGHTSSRMVELVYGHLNMDTFRRAVRELPPMPDGALNGFSKPKQRGRSKSTGST